MSVHKLNNAEIVAYYDRISAKRFDPIFLQDTGITEVPAPIDDVVTVNKHMESYILQASSSRSLFFHDSFKPLQFLHFSDIHAMIELWSRICQFVNHYETISFALHTGDYCCSSNDQYKDCYKEGTDCLKPVLNCVGNHDVVDNSANPVSQEIVWSKLFNHTENWNVNFPNRPFPMYYYMDHPDSNIRLIVLDQYHNIDEQKCWLNKLLQDARSKGFHVITASHEASAKITEKLDVTFQTLTPYKENYLPVFETILADFIKQGGTHICNLCGHYHADWFGYTENGVLNIAVEAATDWAGWTDGVRIRGTGTYDSFNIVTVDTVLGLIKLVRIGNQSDYFLRSKRCLCYDYIHKTIISNT